jgi:hypothetical protein
MNSSQRVVLEIKIAPENGVVEEGGTMIVEVIEECGERYVQLRDMHNPEWMFPIMDEIQWSRIKTSVNFVIKICA